MDEFKRNVEKGIESNKLRIQAEVKEKFESILAMLKEQFESIMAMLKEQFESITAMVDDGYDSTVRTAVTEIERYSRDANPTPARTNMKLEFKHGITKIISTGKEIKGEEGVPIEVAPVDDSTGDAVDSGPAASAKVEIVPLKGKPEGDDWTSEEFNSNIVPELVGKKLPILAGNLPLQLQKGVAVLNNIYFRHHASTIKPSKFMLGARVVGYCRVREAITEPFILKDYRFKFKEKHLNPSLTDKVWRLVNIGKGGEIERRLRLSKIDTVEEFLIRLLRDPQGLKEIVNSQAKKWEATVRNARACKSDERVYFYMDHDQKTGIIFNILGDVQRLYPDTLSDQQKAGLLASAYANWEEEVKAFDDENSLEQHLASLTALDSLNTGASEMVDESSSRANFPGENCDQDYESMFEATAFDDQTCLEQHSACLSPYSAMMMDHLLDSPYMDTNGGAAAAEPSRSKSGPDRWMRIFCILTWLIRKERVCGEVTPRRKRKVE